MLLELNKEEKGVFKLIAQSTEGRVLSSFIKRLISQIESVRTKTTLSNEARIEVANVLEENFINRLKLISSETEEPTTNEHE